ncbi:MAG: glycosyltransferase family 4 protein [Pseudomonadota bacterium]
MIAPRIAISANTAWNISNFRGGLLHSLQDEGYEVVAIAPPDEHVSRLEHQGYRFLPLKMDNKGTDPIKDARLFRRYRNVLQREKPAVFLGYTIKPNIYGSLAAQNLRIPVINNISGLGTAFIRDTVITSIVKRLYKASLKGSDCIFFQNQDDLDTFAEKDLVQVDRCRLLPGSGIDLTRFSPPPPPKDRDQSAIKFLLIGRLVYDKGVGEYVEAARILRKSHPDVECQILGFLDVENRTAVSREDVDNWVGEGLIRYLGSSNDVRTHIAQSDCVVLPSYREGTPRTLLEAAAMGKPIITTDVPGCREVVEDGLNGYLCEARSAQSLAAKMQEFCALSDAERRRLGEAGRSKMEREFDEQIVIDRYKEAITDALTSRGIMPPKQRAIRNSRAAL